MLSQGDWRSTTPCGLQKRRCPSPGRQAPNSNLLVDLSLRDGGDKEQAEPLLTQALEAQRSLADARQNPATTNEDILRLGQTLKCRGDLLKLNGKFSDAKQVYTDAISELERARTAEPNNAEARTEFAEAVDNRGFIHRELGEPTAAETDYRRGIEVLEKLVAEFPTAPRHRELLAKVYDNLGWLEQETTRLEDAEAHLRRVVRPAVCPKTFPSGWNIGACWPED